jgi:hypothetical protein
MTIRVRLSALLIASTLTLAGCGGSDSGSDKGVADLSADKILAAAEKQLAEEDFITIKGEGSDAESGSEIEVDIAFAGETASGTIGFSGMKLEVLKADGKSYFKADKEFFASSGTPAEAMNLIGDRWVLIDPNSSSFAEIASFVSRKEFVEVLLEPENKVTKGKEKQVNGVDCVALKNDGSTFYFDKSDGRPVSLITNDKGEGALDFSYDKIEEAEGPPAGEVVDLSKLGS